MVSTGSGRGPLEDLQVASLIVVPPLVARSRHDGRPRWSPTMGNSADVLRTCLCHDGASSSPCGAPRGNSADVLRTCLCHEGASSSLCGAPKGDPADVLGTCAAAQAGARPLGTASEAAEREPAALVAAEEAAAPHGAQPGAAGCAARLLVCYLGFVLLLLGISIGAWTYGSHDGSTEAVATAAVPLLLAAVPLLLVTIAVEVLFDFLVVFLVPVLVDLWAGLDRICCVARAAYAVLNRKVAVAVLIVLIWTVPLVNPRGGSGQCCWPPSWLIARLRSDYWCDYGRGTGSSDRCARVGRGTSSSGRCVARGGSCTA